jgi:hypothetical protein
LRKRGCWLVVAGALLLGALLLVALALPAELASSVLTVHGDPAGWRTVEVDSTDGGPHLVVERPGPIVDFPELGYGPHPLRIVYADGTTVWASYFHLDTGMRRRVDVYATRVPGGDTVKFRCVIRNRPVIFGRSETLFDGSVEAGKTSRGRPLTLSSV